MARLTLALDHLVLAAPTLDAGVAWIAARTGLAVGPGGTHPGAGTHNRLLRLGDCYIEVIARNPADTPTRPRWFGLDDPAWAPDTATTPRFVTWLLRTNDLDAALRLPGAQGHAVAASRGTLAWRIGGTPDGRMPCDGAYPTFLQWPDGIGAVAQMPDSGAQLTDLRICHPHARRIDAALAPYLDEPRVRLVEGPLSLTPEIAGPA